VSLFAHVLLKQKFSISARILFNDRKTNIFDLSGLENKILY